MSLALKKDISAWKQAGLEPIEVNEDAVTQTIKIDYNTVTGRFTSDLRRIDGLQAISLLFSVACQIYKDSFGSFPKIPLSSGSGTFAAKLDNDKLTIGISPLADIAVVKGIIAASLIKVIERSEGLVPEKLYEIFTCQLDTKSG